MTSGLLSWREWLELRLGEPDWLIPGLLEQGGGGLLHGGARSFKSFFMLRACLDIAAGRALFGLFPAHPPRPTMMYQAEGTKRGWRKRMENVRTDYPSDLPFWSKHTAIEKLDTPTGDRAMRLALAAHRPALLTLDPIAEFLLGADTDPVAVQRWTATVNGWREEFGCAVVLVHHDRQPLRYSAQGTMKTLDAGMEEARGHTRLTAWADLIIGMKRKGDITTAQVQKVREEKDERQFSFKLVDGGLVPVDQADTVGQAVLAAVVGNVWLADVIRAVCTSSAANDRTVRRAVARLVERGDLLQVTRAGRISLHRPKEET